MLLTPPYSANLALCYLFPLFQVYGGHQGNQFSKRGQHQESCVTELQKILKYFQKCVGACQRRLAKCVGLLWRAIEIDLLWQRSRNFSETPWIQAPIWSALALRQLVQLLNSKTFIWLLNTFFNLIGGPLPNSFKQNISNSWERVQQGQYSFWLIPVVWKFPPNLRGLKMHAQPVAACYGMNVTLRANCLIP